jgi:hypothetical protein
MLILLFLNKPTADRTHIYLNFSTENDPGTLCICIHMNLHRKDKVVPCA